MLVHNVPNEVLEQSVFVVKMAVELNVGVEYETFSEAENAVSDFCAQN